MSESTSTDTAPDTDPANTTPTDTAAKEYVVLIVGDADRWWTTMTEEERTAGYEAYVRFDEELTKRGHQVTGGAELHGMATARSIPPGGGPVTEGPYAESAEQVGGFYQVQTTDLADLLDCCQVIARIGDGIQVRPVVTPEERQS